MQNFCVVHKRKSILVNAVIVSTRRLVDGFLFSNILNLTTSHQQYENLVDLFGNKPYLPILYNNSYIKVTPYFHLFRCIVAPYKQTVVICVPHIVYTCSSRMTMAGMTDHGRCNDGYIFAGRLARCVT